MSKRKQHTVPLTKIRFIVFDRYSAAGIPRPDPKTACHFCEGMGMLPPKKTSNPNWVDGKFRTCPKCNGTRLRKQRA